MPNYSEASLVRQVLVGVIDATLSVAIISVMLITQMPEAVYSNLESVNGSLLVLIFFVLYRVVSLLFLNQTVGMRLFNLVLLNGEEQPLTRWEKLLAALFVLYRGTDYYHATR
jgi:hypothetical protein